MKEEIKPENKVMNRSQELGGLISGPGLFLWFSSAFHSSSLTETMPSPRSYCSLTYLFIHFMNTSVGVQLLNCCLTLCDPLDCSPPGSSVHGVLQARILGWFTIPFSRGSSQPRDLTHISCTAGRFFTTEPPGKPLMNLYAQSVGCHFLPHHEHVDAHEQY